MTTLSPIYAIADRHVDQVAALDPTSATGAGIAGHDDQLTDYSPAATAERARLTYDTLAALAAAPIESDDDRIAAAVMQERLQLNLDLYYANERLRDVRVHRESGPVDPFVFRPHGVRHRRRLGHRARPNVARAGRRRECRSCAARGHGAAASSPRAARRSRARSRPRRGAATHRSSATSPNAGPTMTDSHARPKPPRLHTASSRRSCATSTHPWPTSTIRSARRATRCSRARSTASSSTCTTHTRGAGKSCTASRKRCGRSVSASFPAHRCRRSSSTSRTTRRARSTASTSSRLGTRTSSTRRSPNSTARTSTSPSRCIDARR